MRPTAAKASDAAQVLGVELTGLTPDIVNKAYRSKSKECHPDLHGTAKLELWSRVSWAKECLTRYFETTPTLPREQAQATNDRGDCRACNGSGRVALTSSRGFASKLTVMCVMCNGTGSTEEK